MDVDLPGGERSLAIARGVNFAWGYDSDRAGAELGVSVADDPPELYYDEYVQALI
jgi:hypothetical protein